MKLALLPVLGGWLNTALLSLTLSIGVFAESTESPEPQRRIGPATLPATLRSPFAQEVLPTSAPGKPTLASLLPGLTYDTSFVCQRWFPQGPAPGTNGDLNIVPDHQTSGGVSAIAPHPTNPNTVYIGTVNGGVWRTDNATSNKVVWKALTDDQLSLSIGG